MNHIKKSPKGARSLARLWAVKAWVQHTHETLSFEDLWADVQRFQHDPDLLPEGAYHHSDEEFCQTLIQTSLTKDAFLRLHIQSILPATWPWDRLDPLITAVLCIACAERIALPQHPKAMIISEYVDIAAMFCSTKSISLVNALLDKALQALENDTSQNHGMRNI